MENGWLMVVTPDGAVVEVRGGAPDAWVGKNAANDPALPESVRETAELLLREARWSKKDGWVERAFAEADTASGTPGVEILLLEAVPLRRTKTPLFEVLTRTTEALMVQARAAEVTLKLEADPEMPRAFSLDTEKIAWGVATLVGSALRHVAASSRREKTVRVTARYEAKDGEVVIAVHDNGPGIPHEKLRWLLERDPDTQQATGLALLLLHDVVVAHGGHMNVESSTDARHHGTTVTMYLPGTE